MLPPAGLLPGVALHPEDGDAAMRTHCTRGNSLLLTLPFDRVVFRGVLVQLAVLAARVRTVVGRRQVLALDLQDGLELGPEPGDLPEQLVEDAGERLGRRARHPSGAARALDARLCEQIRDVQLEARVARLAGEVERHAGVTPEDGTAGGCGRHAVASMGAAGGASSAAHAAFALGQAWLTVRARAPSRQGRRHSCEFRGIAACCHGTPGVHAPCGYPGPDRERCRANSLLSTPEVRTAWNS